LKCILCKQLTMPGRKSTGAPPQVKPRIKDRKKNRSLNALAIAEKQVPTFSKSSINPFDSFEGCASKRLRGGDHGDSENEDEARRGKKQKGGHGGREGDQIERGSDSDGNEWVVGGVNSNEDSDLDSDEAFGESDEEGFEGFMLRGSSKAQPNIKPRSISNAVDLKEDGLEEFDLHDDGTSEQSDGLGDGAIDLAAMLDNSDEDAKKGVRTVLKPNEGHDDGEPTIQIPFTDACKPSASDEGSIFTNSDTEDEQPNPTQLKSLQQLISNMDSRNSNILSQSIRATNAQESMTPSEFGISSVKKLTVADLIPSITDSNLKRSLKLLANHDSKPSSKTSGIPKKLAVPLPKRQQDRLDRAAAYDKSKETLNRWIDTVKHNRRAEHLAFPLQDSNAAAAPGAQNLLPLIHSQPVTDLEGAIQNILEDSGLGPRNHRPGGDPDDEAFDGLEPNKLSLQEVQARRAELRRARELLFREETRSRRIKKIKSKSYRRVHRKEREKIAQQEKVALAATGLDNSENEQERFDRRRAEERVGARHRESKWAKGIKDSGRAAWDEEARLGIVERARRGDELTKRIQGRESHTDESSLSTSESDSDDIATDELRGETQASLERFRNGVKKLNNSKDMHDSSKIDLKFGLASMKFMQRADALRKERNDTDLELLRREAAEEDTSSEEGEEAGRGRRQFGPVKSLTKAPRSLEQEVRSDFEEKDGSELGDQYQGSLQGDEQQIIVDSRPAAETKDLRKNSRAAQEKRGKRGKDTDAFPDTAENPWLSSLKSSRRDFLHVGDSQADAIILPALTADGHIGPISRMIGSKAQEALKNPLIREKPQKSAQNSEIRLLDETFDSESEDNENGNVPLIMRDQELIRKAFAGDEVVADFEREKQATTRDEDEQVIDSALPGWGNWTGAGISKKEQKRNRVRFLSKTDGIKKESRKDAKLDRVIINEKRVPKVSHLQAPYVATTKVL
jgi:U3 small nucleolar RNA-associated protein 14